MVDWTVLEGKRVNAQAISAVVSALQFLFTRAVMTLHKILSDCVSKIIRHNCGSEAPTGPPAGRGVRAKYPVGIDARRYDVQVDGHSCIKG